MSTRASFEQKMNELHLHLHSSLIRVCVKGGIVAKAKIFDLLDEARQEGIKAIASAASGESSHG